MDRWTRLGIEAYRGGNRAQAQRFFRYALMEKPDDVRSWLWLVEVVDADSERKRCLEQVLKIEPNHAMARKALDELNDRLASGYLPHVSPFGGFGSDIEENEMILASVEVRSTPPFMTAIAEREAQETVPQEHPVSSFLRHSKTLRLAGFILAILALLTLAGFIIFH